MADLTTLRRSPLHDMAAEIRKGAVPGDRSVWLLEWPFLGMVSIRVDPASETARRIEGVLGTPLPRSVGEVSHQGPHTVLWLGPDEWLVVSQMAPETLLDGVTGTSGGLRAAARGGHAAVVDVSANRTVLEVAGPGAREVLEKGCPADLHPRSFGDHTAIATTLARVPVLLWKVDTGLFRILPRSSYAPYVASWLLDAVQELAPRAPAAGGA